KSPLTLRLGLTAMADVEELPFDEKLPILAERLAQAIATDDAREGLSAFFEKRKPNWTGK
ncbi:MAG TPA: enoyl-CoA hydratase, partial [Polyangiaceae bacterium]|nr:enoyl-CoA hydratase [Polyangiaceae bacterium]